MNPSATTATPFETWTTCRTPLTARAAVGSKLFTLPPATGHRSMDATSIPGTCTSIPKMARPVTLSGVSRRLTGLPM
jgi:hypothetical protein